jgi:hypothetical protein
MQIVGAFGARERTGIDASRSGHPLDLGDAATGALHAARRELLPDAERAARSDWRDRRLMALARHLEAAAAGGIARS